MLQDECLDCCSTYGGAPSKDKPPKQQKKSQSRDFPEEEDSERYHPQPWKEAWHLVLLWPFSMCAKEEFYSMSAFDNARSSCLSRVRHASQKGQAAWWAGKAACSHGWSSLTPAKENKAAGGRGRCPSVSGRCSYFPQPPALRECCACMCGAALACLFRRACAESALLSLLLK